MCTRSTYTRSLDDLDPNLVVEILLRLPHKYVICCKCVSKKWLYLITSPNFVSHFSSMKKELWTFMYPPDEQRCALSATSKDSIFEGPRFSLNFLPCYTVQSQGNEPICVVKTFNDLFLCCKRKRFQWVYYICNPLTKQWVALPPSRYCYENVCVNFTCYKKDSTTQQPNGVAFNTQYWCKVVKIFKNDRTNKLDLEIFSSKTGQWIEKKVLVSNANNGYGCTIHDAITFDGKLILFGLKRHEKKNIIISMADVDGGSNEAHMLMFGSRDDFEAWHKCSHGPTSMVSQGHLLLAWVTNSTNTPTLKIWEFKSCELRMVHEVDFTQIVSDNEWISKDYLRSIMQEGLILRRNEGRIRVPIVLGLDPNDENIVYLNLIYSDTMAKYDIRRRTLNLVPDTCVVSFAKPNKNVFQLVLPLWPTMVPQLVSPD